MEVVNNFNTATRFLAEIKVQIAEDYKQDPGQRDEILKQLGFSTYYRKAKNGSQEAMIQLLNAFKTNLKDNHRDDLINKGIAPTSLQNILMLGETLQQAEVTQEGHKSHRKIITNEGITAFNQLYDQVISICKIAAKFYKGQPLLQAQFTFGKRIEAQRFQTAAAPLPEAK